MRSRVEGGLMWKDVTQRSLERVLEELMGESAFLKVRSDLYPSPGGERSPRPIPDTALPQDWDPTAPCFVCLGTSHASTQVRKHEVLYIREL
ncbi:hypothetical protein E2C01_084972 [Portunus trituberculatus]|uniref:Uncharacterized protein n=1 Tax=Portunus trituberculatus TaxID=210409 RepID=A0A5B7J7N3_PORTR|nr:hypothetical protein [Portunus trituberculatus]